MTITVGPSFCGKTFVVNKLKLKRLDDNMNSINIITRSPEQYETVELYINRIINKIISEEVGDKWKQIRIFVWYSMRFWTIVRNY